MLPKFLGERCQIEKQLPYVDALDRKILAELQQDGRLTITELAERVGLSISPCHRRLRTLERSGAISGYHAHLDANNLGLTFEALVFVTMRSGDRDTVHDFEQVRRRHPSRSAGRNDSSVSPTTSCASSRPTCTLSKSSMTNVSPASPACSASAPPS